MEPEPVPVFAIVSRLVLVASRKFAVMVVSVFSTTEHPKVPEHPPPLHPRKIEPWLADGRRVTWVPTVKLAEHVEPQSIAAGPLLM